MRTVVDEIAPGGGLLLTVEEVAEELRLGRSTVYALIGQRRLRSVRIGRARRVTRTAMVEFVEELQNESGLHDGGPL